MLTVKVFIIFLNFFPVNTATTEGNHLADYYNVQIFDKLIMRHKYSCGEIFVRDEDTKPELSIKIIDWFREDNQWESSMCEWVWLARRKV